MPKKTPVNGYSLFASDYGKKKNISMAQACKEAAGLWGNLNPAEKKRYTDKAKEIKGTAMKLTSNREVITEIEKKYADAANAEESLKIQTKNLIVRHDSILENLGDVYFYIMHVNSYCYHAPSDRTLAAEIALARFTLNDGIRDVYHKIVHPGPLPLGYSGEARRISQETHQIPLPEANVQCNSGIIIDEISDFLLEKQNDDGYPLIFVQEYYRTPTKNVLYHMCEDFGYDSSKFRVCALEWLLFYLRNRREMVWPALSSAVIEIERDVYDYINDICCDFHRDIDEYKTCSLSRAQRAAYIICDNICPDMGIRMTAGCHVPLQGATALVELDRSVIDSHKVTSRQQQRTHSPPTASQVYAESMITESELYSDAPLEFKASQPEVDIMSVNNEWQTVAGKGRKEKPFQMTTAMNVQASIERAYALSSQASSTKSSVGVGQGRGLRRPNTVSEAAKMDNLSHSTAEFYSDVVNRARGRGSAGRGVSN